MSEDNKDEQEQNIPDLDKMKEKIKNFDRYKLSDDWEVMFKARYSAGYKTISLMRFKKKM